MSTIKLCGITALFGFSLDTNKHQDLMRLMFLLVDGTERTPDAPVFSRRSACVCLSRLVSHAQISSHFYSHDNQQGIYGRRNSANQHLSAIMAGNSLAFLSPIVLTTITFIPFFLWFFLIFLHFLLADDKEARLEVFQTMYAFYEWWDSVQLVNSCAC